MVMVPENIPEIKRFTAALKLKQQARMMFTRLLAVFALHIGAVSAVQAAGMIRTAPCHRAQVGRSLGRRWWRNYHPLRTLQDALLNLETKSGRYVFIIDPTLHGQQGKKTENTFSTGNRERHPGQRRRYSKYKYARKSCHSFVVGLLITPSGIRIPFHKPFCTKAYCQEKNRTFRTQTELGADLIRELPLPDGAEVVVLGDTSFDAQCIREACAEREYSWITPVNPERVLAGGKPRPQVKSLVTRLRPDQFQTIRLSPNGGEWAVYRRVSRYRRGSKTKPRAYYVHQERREVHSVGEVQLVFSTTQPPGKTRKVAVERILMTSDLKLSTRTIVELYNLRWQIALFFKEMKTTLGMTRYRFRDFERVEHWVEMALVSFVYLEWYRARQLARRDVPKEEKQWWEWQRTHGICQAVRQHAEVAELRYLAERLETPGGTRRLRRDLANAYSPEYRIPT